MARYDPIKNLIGQGLKRLSNKNKDNNQVNEQTNNQTNETLNEQIEDGTIQQPITLEQETQQPTTLEQEIQQQDIKEPPHRSSSYRQMANTTNQPGLTSSINQLWQKGVSSPFSAGLDDYSKTKEERGETDFDQLNLGGKMLYTAGAGVGVAKRLVGWTKDKAIPTVKQVNETKKVNDEITKKEKHIFLGYNKGYPLELSLLQDKTIGNTLAEPLLGGGENMNDVFMSDLIKYANGEITFEDFYNKDKELFYLKEGLPSSTANDYLSDTKNVFNPYNLTEDDIEKLKSTGFHRNDKYIPTEDEFQLFIDTYSDNIEIKNTIYEEHGLTNTTENIDVTESTQSEFKQLYSDVANAGIIDAINQKINPANRATVELSINGAIQNQFNRLYVEFETVIKAATEASQKDPSELTEADKYALIKWKQAKDILKASAEGLNNWAIQTINASKNGEIDYYLEEYEGGETLGDVLSNPAKVVAGAHGYAVNEHASAIDVAQQFNENFNYHYKELNGGTNVFDRLGHVLTPTQWWLSEMGQGIAELNRDILGQKERNAFADQDFNVGQLLRTDLTPGQRVRRSYTSQLGEYVPEIVGSLVPDMALTAVTGGGALPLLLKQANRVKRLKNALKVKKTVKEINLIKDATQKAKALSKAKTELGKLSDVSKLAQKYQNLPTKWKLGLELTDKFITNGIVDQTINAQYALYDTESYTPTYEQFAIGGTVLTEWIPLIWQFRLGKFARGAKNIDLGGRGIWDLADYMDSSPEAKQYIIGVLGKDLSYTPLEDLKELANGFGDIMRATKQEYDKLSKEGKKAVGDWTKKTMYNFINQTYGSNSQVGKAVRAIVTNNSTNPADIVKYLGGLSGKVSVGPYISSIKLKGKPEMFLFSKQGYDTKLDFLDGGFSSRLSKGFTQEDIDKISKIEGFSDVSKDEGKYFVEVDGKKYLTDDGLKRFKIERLDTPLESLGLELARVDETKELFRERLKQLVNKGKNIKDTTVDMVAESGAYDDVVDMVKEIVC